MSLIDTFVQCGLLLLECPAPCATKSTQLARAIATLELLESNMAMALVLLEKYQSNCVTCLGSASTCYYMMIASLIVANKFLNDQSYTLKTWNMVLGKCSPMDVLLPLLNQLESHFLAALNYAVNAKAKPSMWQRFKALDQSHIGRFEGIMSCDVHHVVRRAACCPALHTGRAIILSYSTIAGDVWRCSARLGSFTNPTVCHVSVVPPNACHSNVHGCRRRVVFAYAADFCLEASVQTKTSWHHVLGPFPST